MGDAGPPSARGRPSSNELVSVIIPLWNARDYVRQTVESALGQTYRPVEILVVDDGSTDGSREVIGDLIHSGKVRYLRQDNSGVSEARNRGMREARGRYLAFLDSDDLWSADKLERQVSALTERRMPACYCGFCSLNDVTDEAVEYPSAYVYREGFIAYSFLGYSSWCWISTLVVDAELVSRHSLGFTPGCSRGEDIEFIVKLLMLAPIACVAESLATYRVRGGSLSAFHSTSHLIGEVEMWERVIHWVRERRVDIPSAYDTYRLRRMIGGFNIPYAVGESIYRFEKSGRRAEATVRVLARRYGRYLLRTRLVNGRKSLNLVLLLPRLIYGWLLCRISMRG